MKEFTASEDAVVLFFDEGRFGTKPTLGRGLGFRGTRMVVNIKPGYKNFYCYSAVSPHTGAAFSLLLPTVNTDMMSLYLAHLAEEFHGKKVFIIMDQAGWHRSADLVVPASVTIRYLPPYSPELNPVERLWQWLRRRACRNRLFRTIEEIESALVAAFQQLSPRSLASLCACSYL